jgi:hypothetical protein
LPWEIFRVQVGGHTVELYTKSGNCEYSPLRTLPNIFLIREKGGAYNNLIALVPTYNFGFTILTASTTSSKVWEDLTNVMAAKILPALETVGKGQAVENFVGRYSSTALNSSLSITTDELPGLKVAQWISNGTDLKAMLDLTLGSDFRLIPNELYKAASGRIGFTGVYQSPMTGEKGNSTDFYWPCTSWTGVSALTYGNVGLEQFVFEVERGSGRARGVFSKGLRIVMGREE